jgi:hypothetical protein
VVVIYTDGGIVRPCDEEGEIRKTEPGDILSGLVPFLLVDIPEDWRPGDAGLGFIVARSTRGRSFPRKWLEGM